MKNWNNKSAYNMDCQILIARGYTPDVTSDGLCQKPQKDTLH